MRIEFSRGNFIDISKTKEGKIAIILSSKDVENSRKTIVNSVEISQEEFISMINDLELNSKKGK